MKEKIHLGAIYIIGDKDSFDMSTLGPEAEGRNVIFLEPSKKKGYARKLLDRYFKRNK